jgi:hypothetical protein
MRILLSLLLRGRRSRARPTHNAGHQVQNILFANVEATPEMNRPTVYGTGRRTLANPVIAQSQNLWSAVDHTAAMAFQHEHIVHREHDIRAVSEADV